MAYLDGQHFFLIEKHYLGCKLEACMAVETAVPLFNPPSPKGSFTSPHSHLCYQFFMGTSYSLCTVKKNTRLGCISISICKKQNAVIRYTLHTMIF